MAGSTDICPFAHLLKNGQLIKSEKEIEFPDYSIQTSPWITGNFEKKDTVTIDQVKDLRDTPVDSVLDLIGNTPMVRLDRLKKHFNLKCNLFAKCEFFNPGGSVKDRIGKSMLEGGEKDGVLADVETIIEPTSGNTGIGLALAASLKGYQMMITLPEKMSQEKANMMMALGGEIIRTPTECMWNDPHSHIGVAIHMRNNIPRSYVLDQYLNPNNPLIHYETTGAEILRQCKNKVDMVVVAAGTGGTISGVGKRMKDYCPSCVVVGVDPKGSILAVPDSLNDEKRFMSYKVEGIGYDFIPSVLDRSVVDVWIKTDDPESFEMARLIIRLEGLLVGGSSGSALAGALQACRDLKEDQNCVVIFPDSSRNYINKFVSMDWMIDNGFSKLPADDRRFLVFGDEKVSSLPLKETVSISKTEKIRKVLDIMATKNVTAVPVVNEKKQIIGIVQQDDIFNRLGKRCLRCEDDVSNVIIKNYKKCMKDQPLREVAHMLTMNSFVAVDTIEPILITKNDLLLWISSKST